MRVPRRRTGRRGTSISTLTLEISLQETTETMNQSQHYADQHMSEAERRTMAEHFPDAGYLPDWYLDVAELLEMRLEDALATKYLERVDGVKGIYPATHTAIYGAPGTGKTMLAKFAAHQAVNEGHRVLHVDLDDNLPQVLAQDVQAFGVTKERMIKHWNIAQPDSVERLQAIWQRVIDTGDYSIVIIDSMAGLEGIVNADTNGALEFVKGIYQPYIKTLMNAGVSVITIDHTSKDPQARGAAGSIQKLAKADLALNVVAPQDTPGLVPGQSSSVAIYVDKDRYGVTKAASQLREYKHAQRVLFGTFNIPAAGLAYASIQKPAEQIVSYEF